MGIDLIIENYRLDLVCGRLAYGCDIEQLLDYVGELRNKIVELEGEVSCYENYKDNLRSNIVNAIGNSVGDIVDIILDS